MTAFAESTTIAADSARASAARAAVSKATAVSGVAVARSVANRADARVAASGPPTDEESDTASADPPQPSNTSDHTVSPRSGPGVGKSSRAPPNVIAVWCVVDARSSASSASLASCSKAPSRRARRSARRLIASVAAAVGAPPPPAEDSAARLSTSSAAEYAASGADAAGAETAAGTCTPSTAAPGVAPGWTRRRAPDVRGARSREDAAWHPAFALGACAGPLLRTARARRPSMGAPRRSAARCASPGGLGITEGPGWVELRGANRGGPRFGSLRRVAGAATPRRVGSTRQSHRKAATRRDSVPPRGAPSRPGSRVRRVCRRTATRTRPSRARRKFPSGTPR